MNKDISKPRCLYIVTNYSLQDEMKTKSLVYMLLVNEAASIDKKHLNGIGKSVSEPYTKAKDQLFKSLDHLKHAKNTNVVQLEASQQAKIQAQYVSAKNDFFETIDNVKKQGETALVENHQKNKKDYEMAKNELFEVIAKVEKSAN